MHANPINGERKKKMSPQFVSHVYTNLTDTNGKTNNARF